LRERSASIDDAEDKEATLEFKDKELEQRWSVEGHLLNMKLGCQQLLLLNTFWSCFSCYMLLHGGKRKWAYWIDLIFLIVISTGVILCLRRPSVPLYYVIICTWFVFAFIHGIQPWSPTCEDLVAACSEKCHRHQALLLATFNMDCGLQGQTTVHTVMVTLLLSSRLITSLRMMIINWALIVLYLIGTALLALHPFRNPQHLIYNEADVWTTAAILFFVTLVAGRRKFFIEKGQRSKFFYDQEQAAATKKVFHLLEYMVPFHVIVPMLKNPGGVIAEQKQTASILFVMIEDFDQHAQHLGAEKLMEFLNNTFTMMDLVCGKHSVTKIETVGEEYVCAVVVVPEDEEEAQVNGHSVVLGRLIKAAAEIMAARKPKMGLPVTFKMGLHTGPVVAGVIGQKLPRFRLFGDTVNTAARMMQKGPSGSLQFGQETQRELPPWVEVEYRGKIEMKGKGQVDCWLYKPTERKSVQFDRMQVEALEMDAPSPTSPSTPSRGFRASILRAGRSVSRSFSRAESAEDATPQMRRTTVGQSVLMRDASSAVQALQRENTTNEDEMSGQEGKFQLVLRELQQKSSFKVRSWKWWFSVFLRTPEFTSEIEDKWQRWYHENTICKKLESRLDRQSLALAILTAVEVFACTFLEGLQGLSNAHWRGNDGLGVVRLPIFLACRGLAWLIIWTWQRLAKAQHRLLRHPNEAQKLLAGSFGLIAVLVLISYDAISEVRHVEYDKDASEGAAVFTSAALREMMIKHTRGSGVFALIMFPVYFLVATQHQFRFIHTCIFWIIPLAMACFWRQLCGVKGYNCNLYLSMASKMMLCLICMLHSTMAWSGERNSRLRFLAQRSVQISRHRIDSIASTLMPPLVVEELRSLPLTAELPSHKYKKATIAQSDLCGFTKLASTRKPEEVVQFIGELFGKFDVLTDKHQVYKVETVGDAYIAGQADLPLTQKNHPTSVVLFGLEMVSEVQGWSAQRGWSVSCRVGIAHGECIGGIVGTEMQRYHLFGELMSELEVLESTAPEGCVQVSSACKEVVEEQMRAEGIPSQLVSFDHRKLPHLMTSKGDVIPFEKAGGATYIVRSNSIFRGWVGA